MTKRNNRWRVFADARMQGILCVRIAIYWLVCQLAMCLAIVGVASLDGAEGGGNVVPFLMPAFCFSLFILPVALLDAVVYTNRIAGPLLNFRRKFSLLVRSGVSDPVKFRPGDYFSDLADNFNCLRDQLVQRQDGVPNQEPLAKYETAAGN